MRGIFNKLEQGILVLGNKGDIKFCNKWLLNQLRWDSEKLEGKYFSHLFHTQMNEVKDLLFYSQVNQAIQLYDCTYEVQSFHIEVEERLWEDNKCTFIILKEYKKELFAKKDLENYLEGLPFITWIKDCEGRYVYINNEYITRREFIESYARDNISQAEDLCKLDIVGKTDKDIWCTQLAEKIVQKDLIILQEKQAQTYEELIECESETLSCNVCKIPLLDKEGEVEYIVGIKSDIIKTKQDEYSGCGEQIKPNQYSNILTSHIAVIMKNKELSEEIKEITKRKELTEEEGMKNKIFSDMAHEFKTPLNIILAMMQLIQKSIEDGTIQYNEDFKLSKYISTVKQNAYRLLRLMNNVVDMSRIDAGYYKINLQNYNIIEVIEDITMSVVEYTREKDIEIIFDTEVEELEIACDPDKIERIMLNLLSNAIKYVTVDGKIEVNLRIDNKDLLISVKDNGIGIPEDKLQIIFERFVQADDVFTKMGQGSGIGLSLVESLVGLHGGEVWAESSLGEGLEVFIKLPIHLVTHVEERPSLSMRQSKVEKCTIEFSDIYNRY